MIYTLFQWETFFKILTNCIFVSIPEEFYFVMFTLILVGEFEYWIEPECKRIINKFDYVRVFLPTITVAVLSNILRYSGLDYGFYQCIPPLTLYLIIIFTNDIFEDASALKWMAKAFIFLLLGYLSTGILEFLYMPFVLQSTQLAVSDINNNILIGFILSLPSRIIQYSLIAYFVCKKRTLLKGKLSYIIKNPVTLIAYLVLAIINISALLFMFKFIILNDAFNNLSSFTQFIAAIGSILLPLLNILAITWLSYYIKNKEIYDKKTASDKLYKLLKDIEIYTNNGNYDNIKWKLNEISMGIEDVASSLYKEK